MMQQRLKNRKRLHCQVEVACNVKELGRKNKVFTVYPSVDILETVIIAFCLCSDNRHAQNAQHVNQAVWEEKGVWRENEVCSDSMLYIIFHDQVFGNCTCMLDEEWQYSHNYTCRIHSGKFA